MIATTPTSAVLILTSALAMPSLPGDAPRDFQEEKWSQARLESVAAEIRGDIETLRGEKFRQPTEVKLATAESFLQYAREHEEKSSSPEKLATDELMAKMLGMIPASMNLFETELEFLAGQVGGFYDPPTKTFYLMDGCPLGMARIVLAHELDHALDDQLFDIDGKMKSFGGISDAKDPNQSLLEGNSDAQMAYQSVVEGTGTNVMTQWAIKHAKEIDASSMKEIQDRSSRSLAAAPMWLWKPSLAVYLRGASFLVHSESPMAGQINAAKNDDIRRAFTDTPRSMEQVLHPEKYWDEKKRDEPRSVVFDLDKLPEGWRVLRQDTLGEFTLAMLATPEAERKPFDVDNPMAILSLECTNEIAKGWGGDRCVLLAKDDARVLVLATCWDTPRDAAEFYGALRVLRPQLDRSLRALLDTAKFGKHATSGASLEYGAAQDEVKLRLQVGVGKAELERLDKALTYRCDAAKAR